MSETHSEVKTEILENDPIDQFYIRAHQWEEFLTEVGEEHWDDLVCEAGEELERLYPYTGITLHFSGEGLFPFFDDDNNIIGEGYGESGGQYGIGAGIQIARVTKGDGEKVPKILHQILIHKSESQPLASVTQEQSIYALVYLEGEVLPIVNIEEIYGTDTVAQETELLHQNANLCSKAFTSLLRSTGFRRLPRKKQNALVDQTLMDADIRAPVREREALVEGEYAYIPETTGEATEFRLIDIRDTLVSGVCLALDTVEKAALRHKAIRRDTDLADKGAGLCLVIDPLPETRSELNIDEGKVVFVPISGQEIEVVFSGQSWFMQHLEASS